MTSGQRTKSIFITGAAQGIGKATAKLFHEGGWFVGLYDVDTDAVQRLAEELGPNTTHAGKLDVVDVQDWATQLAAFVQRSGGQLNVLLNNAGIAQSGSFEEIELDAHHAIVDVNLKGVMNGCHRAFSYLRDSDDARLINLASASAIYGAADLASYSSTKFAVRGLTEALDLEWRKHGIRVSDIWPLFVKTNMVDGLDLASLKSLGVRLTAQDVARTIWKAAHHRGRHKVHWLVGAQTHALYRATCFLPDRLHRAVTAKLSQA